MMHSKSSPRWFQAAGWVCLTASLTAAFACAQAPSPPALEITLPPAAGELDILVRVVVPGARTAVVSDIAGKLAVAQKSGVAPQVLLFALDEQGQAAAAPTAIELPCPDALMRRPRYALALAAHPKLPLLYVWQDIAAPGKGDPADDPDKDEFCHLLIYDIASDGPRLVQSFAQGGQYARGNLAGSIAVDLAASRLFLPNLCRAVAGGPGVPAIGFARLDSAGLVAADGDDTVEATTSGRKKPSGTPPALARAVREAYLADVKAAHVQSRQVRAMSNMSATFAGYPCGLSYFDVSEDVTLVGGALGPVTWDRGNRRAQFSSVTFYPLVGAGYQLRLAGHPTLPVIFVSGLSGAWLYRMEHVDGFPTLTPQRATLIGAALASPPVVLPARRQVAVGGTNAVHLVGFDEQGVFGRERIDVPVLAAAVQALTYSPRFDRLYAAVEKVKP